MRGAKASRIFISGSSEVYLACAFFAGGFAAAALIARTLSRSLSRILRLRFSLALSPLIDDMDFLVAQSYSTEQRGSNLRQKRGRPLEDAQLETRNHKLLLGRLLSWSHAGSALRL